METTGWSITATALLDVTEVKHAKQSKNCIFQYTLYKSLIIKESLYCTKAIDKGKKLIMGMFKKYNEKKTTAVRDAKNVSPS